MNSVQNSEKKKGGRSPVITMLIISLVLGGAVFLLNRVITASANTSDYSLALGTYPIISGSRIGTCQFCHTSSIPNLNPYGKAYKALGRNNAASLHMIEALDSDGDGYTNIQEIAALTFPGDASDFPQPPTNTPTSIPPTATSTNTAVPPTATSVPPTATNTGVPPTATNTSVPPTATNTGVPPTPTNTSVAPTPTNQGYPPPATETAVPTSQPTVGVPMEPTKTEEVEETEKPEETEHPEETEQPEKHERTKEPTERPENTRVVVTRTPRPTKTMRPSRTPRATRVYPTRTATAVCIRDDDSNKQSNSSTYGSAADFNNRIRCPRGYHGLGEYSSDFANFKPIYSFYSRRSR